MITIEIFQNSFLVRIEYGSDKKAELFKNLNEALKYISDYWNII